jgi:ABC-type lipoprotein release transport system permease subunit
MTLKTIWQLKKIALRNLARHKVKTVITILAIMVSVALFIFMDGMISGMSVESRRNIVNYEIGAGKLQAKLYFEKKGDLPGYESFKGWEKYADILDKAGYNAAPRYVFSGTMRSMSGSAPMIINAVDPQAEAKVLRYTPYMEFGRFIQSGEFEVAIGIMAAEKLNVGIPQRPFMLELEALAVSVSADQAEKDFILSLYEELDVDGSYSLLAPAEKIKAGNKRMVLKKNVSKADIARYWNILDLSGRNNVLIQTVIDIKDETGKVYHINQLIPAVVVGIVNSPDPVTNANTAYIPLDALQDETGMMLEGSVTEILVRAKDAREDVLPGKSESAQVITAVLGKDMPDDLAYYTWFDYAKDYLGYEKMEQGATKVLTGLLFLLAFLGISNTILLAILERTKEIGMMRAMGMTDNQMIMIYMLEAGFLGFFGAILGIITGCLINYPMVKYGIDVSAMADSLGGGVGFRVAALFRSMWNIPVIIGSGVIATLLAACMAYFPTRRAVKMPITESLRFE